MTSCKNDCYFVICFMQWSFGVTCWEVFNGGRIPYPGLTAQSLPKLINRGHRMDKPDNLACIDAM